MEFFTPHDFLNGIAAYESDGGKFKRDTAHIKTNRMNISCRYGLDFMAQFISNTPQSNKMRSIIKDGICVELSQTSTYKSDTLIIADSQFEAYQWSIVLGKTKHLFIKRKNAEVDEDDKIVVVTKNLMGNMRLSGFYRIICPFDLNVSLLKPMYTYSLIDFPPFEYNSLMDYQIFSVHEPPYVRPNVIYLLYTHKNDAPIKPDDFFCSICLENKTEMYRIQCSHTLCTECYSGMTKATQCHLCRGLFNHQKIELLTSNSDLLFTKEEVLDNLPVVGASLVFADYVSSHFGFQVVYPRLQKKKKMENVFYECNWPSSRLPRFDTTNLKNVIFIHSGSTKPICQDILHFLCHSSKLDIYVLYDRQSQKTEWETLLE